MRGQVADPAQPNVRTVEARCHSAGLPSHLPRVGGLHRLGVGAPEDVEDVMDRLLLTADSRHYRVMTRGGP